MYLILEQVAGLAGGVSQHALRQSVCLRDGRKSRFIVLVRLKLDFLNTCKNVSPTETVRSEISLTYIPR